MLCPAGPQPSWRLSCNKAHFVAAPLLIWIGWIPPRMQSPTKPDSGFSQAQAWLGKRLEMLYLGQQSTKQSLCVAPKTMWLGRPLWHIVQSEFEYCSVACGLDHFPTELPRIPLQKNLCLMFYLTSVSAVTPDPKVELLARLQLQNLVTRPVENVRDSCVIQSRHGDVCIACHTHTCIHTRMHSLIPLQTSTYHYIQLHTNP